MNKIKVEGHSDLYRDPNTGAIINSNKSEFEKYIKTYRKQKTDSARLDNVESDLSELKSEISDIKSMLIQLMSDNKYSKNEKE